MELRVLLVSPMPPPSSGIGRWAVLLLEWMGTRTPGIKSGTPHIAGTGVTVRTIVRYYKLGLSPEEIAAEYPHLSLAQVYGALAYYHANRDEMDEQMAAEEVESDRIEQEHLRLQKSGA